MRRCLQARVQEGGMRAGPHTTHTNIPQEVVQRSVRSQRIAGVYATDTDRFHDPGGIMLPKYSLVWLAACFCRWRCGGSLSANCNPRFRLVLATVQPPTAFCERKSARWGWKLGSPQVFRVRFAVVSASIGWRVSTEGRARYTPLRRRKSFGRTGAGGEALRFFGTRRIAC